MTGAASRVGTIAAKPAGWSSGIFQTSPGMLRRRALGPFAEGLAQYLAVQVGDVERAKAALRALERWVANVPSEELVEAPGPRARAYRLARQLAATEREAAGLSRQALPFRSGGILASLRDGLEPGDAELLELRHARELAPEEIAFVFERPVDEIELALCTAEARARKLLGSNAPDLAAERATVFVDAFALARSWREEDTPLLGAEEEPPLDPGTLVGGRYRLMERVGVGAFGDVYRAEDIEVEGHRIALKLLRQPSLSEHARRAATRELRLSAAVFHPSLVQLKDHGWFDDRLFIAMPWYEGETLEARIRREPLDRREARAIFEPLARALGALHAAGIRHQDVKPDNVLLAELPGGEILPVLIDLGVAVDADEGLLGGTPLYFPPEVAARFAGDAPDAPPVGPKADVFALALALRNSLEPETQDEVRSGAVSAFVSRRALGAPAAPGQRDLRFLRSTFERWLSVDPDERPSADELADELAILTSPEEKRARRLAIVRWVAPILVISAALFIAAVLTLEARAQREEDAARVARLEAAGVREDLRVADAERRSLESREETLRRRYEESQLSRHELGERLARAETRVETLSAERDALARARAEANETLAELRTRSQEERARAEAQASRAAETIDALEQAVERRRAELREAEATIARVEAARRGAEQALERGQIEMAGLRAQVMERDERISGLEAAHRAASARAEAREVALAEARAELAREARASDDAEAPADE